MRCEAAVKRNEESVYTRNYGLICRICCIQYTVIYLRKEGYTHTHEKTHNGRMNHLNLKPAHLWRRGISRNMVKGVATEARFL